MYALDDVYTFYAQTHSTTGTADADAVPSYRIYKEDTTTPIMTGDMALLDASNTDGFYAKKITLSAANGFEVGKSYCIRTYAAVDTEDGADIERFHIIAAATPTNLAEAVLKLDWSSLTGEAMHSMLNMGRFILNKWDTTSDPGYATIMKEDGITAAYKKAVTSDAGAEPIVSVGDPETP